MKKLLSMFLALCMTFLLCPTLVHAEDISPETQELKDLISEAIKSDNKLVLEKDYTITAAISFEGANGPFTLDLNGHVIRIEEPYAYDHQLISSLNATLILNDSRPDAQHTGEYAGLPAGGVITGSRGDGTVQDKHAEGGGICIKNLTMNGGTIYDCRGSLGGGVSASNFEMNGGAISNCHAKDAGGAVFIRTGGSFTMNGGTIENCSCSDPKSNSIFLEQDATMMVAGDRAINGTVFSNGNIRKSTEADNNLIFNDAVYNSGTIEYGAYYGGIVNEGTISESYHTVSFDLDDGKNPIPTQYFVNINNLPAMEPVAPTKDGYEFTGWYQGDTKYDFTQNVTEDIALTAHWEITKPPVITGLENDKIYCDTVQFDVSDTTGVDSVSANGVELTPDENGTYSLEKGTGKVTVVAKDKLGNETTVAVTVNNGHDLEHFDAKEASFTETGNIEYWYCNVCEKYFSDAQGTKEISLEDTILSKTSPEIIKGKGQSVIEGTKKALSFTSNAPFNQFKQVKLDGKTLDSKNYTAKEGSIVVTLNSDFVSTLKAGKHTISIVSETGEATTEFNIVKDTSKKTNTGVIGNAGLWISMMVSSLDAMLIGFVLKRKNRK